MNRSNSWAWSSMLLATLLFGIGLGLSLGYAFFHPREPVNFISSAPPPDQSESEPPPEPVEAVTPAVKPAAPTVRTTPAAQTTVASIGDYPAGRHLFVTVNGQWLADAAREMLAELKPAGVLLTESNLGSRAQTFALVKEIKAAVGEGDGLGDFPLIAVQQEGGPFNLLGIQDAPSAEAIAASGDPELARRLGREYAEACVGRGIALVFAPVLDVFEVGAINPGLQSRTFGTDYSVVTTFGIAMADGLRQGGVLPVVKHFPGYGAATYGPDGLLVVLNKDYGGLSRVMYPFNEAVSHGVPGVLVGHVAVPALDMENQRRSAALSPVLVNDLLRKRWKFDGVILADDVAFNSMTRAIGPEQATVQALAAGCDAVLFLDPDPNRIRRVASAVASAVVDGTLARESLDGSYARVGRWQEAIGNLHPAEMPSPVRVADQSTPPTALPPAEVPPVAPEPIATVEQTAETQPDPQSMVASAPEEAAPVEEAQPEPQAPEPEVVPESTPAPPEQPGTDAAEETVAESTTEPVDTESDDKVAGATPEASNPETDTESAAAAASEKMAKVETPPIDVKSATPGTPDPTPTPAPPIEETNSEPPIPEPEPEVTPTEPAPQPAPPPAEPIVEVAANATPEEAERSSIVHTVAEDELLSDVATAYSVSLADLVRWNELDSADVAPGTDLTVFLPDGAEQDAATAEKSEAEMAVQEVAVPSGKLVHTVVEGDTLSGVAGRYEVSMADLTLWNGLQDAALTPGQQLTIFLDPDTATPAPMPESPESEAESEAPVIEPATTPTVTAEPTNTQPRPAHYVPKDRTIEYTVKSGDTLMKISREHKTTMQVLMELNKIEDASKIFVGQKLKVPPPN